MSVWGKISGAAAGLLVGGPVGALVGAVAGHFLFDHQGDPGVTFTIAMIALAGKMAKADGSATPKKNSKSSFKDIYQCRRRKKPMYSASTIWRARMWRDTNLMPGRSRICSWAIRPFWKMCWTDLFEIAKADGVLHPAESAFLEHVSEIFGFAPNEFRRIRASHFAPELTDPYVILGVSYVAGEDELRQTYRRLVRENHPDSLIARGVPEEFIRLANDKLASINGAYEKIRIERGLK